MKTYKNLFNKVCTFKNLYEAYLNARKCKRYKGYVLDFSWGIEENILELQSQLLDQTYQHGTYNEFIIYDAKKRYIKAAPFRDRIVHHAVCSVIEPIFDKGFIYDSYACRREKGTHRAVKRLEEFLKSAKAKNENSQLYCLQCDISKYFDSIDHQILQKLLDKKIADEKVRWLLGKIIKSSFDIKFGKDLFDYREVGIPIGNLTSQLFANIYLNELDQFIKHKLHERYYIRYMDDFLILDYDKKKLWEEKEGIEKFLKEKLKLKMNTKKVCIYPVESGIDFLGYKIWADHKLLRKSTVKRFIKRTKKYRVEIEKGNMDKTKFNNSLQSWMSYAKYANSWRLLQGQALKTYIPKSPTKNLLKQVNL